MKTAEKLICRERERESTKYSLRNILGFQKPNDEFYTSKETVLQLIKILKLPKTFTIWCPFDKSNSEFVINFRKKGWKVICSHINDDKLKNHDFYKYTPSKKWDVIISNPPFSKKRILIERCLKFKKPFCLLYGSTIFSQSMGNTLNKCAFWFIQNNCKFTTQKPNVCKSFQCCWLMSKDFKDKFIKNP